MSERRKPSTRYQGERPPKRRQYSPPLPAVKAAKEPKEPKELKEPKEPRETITVSSDTLPSKLKENQSLPTLPKKQNVESSDQEYQSITESGVLAASIQQSRQRWISDGIFDRYWSRPSKKKAQIDNQNPAKETMTRLGVCSMIIEPHVFETTLYTVREPFVQSSLPPPPPPPPPNPIYNPYQDHNTYAPRSHSSYGQSNYPQHQSHQSNSSTLKLPPFREGFAQYSTPGPPLYHSPIAAPKPVTERPQSRDAETPPNPGPDPVANDSEKPTDPVIQMLATRAASDHNLKSLMKVVASGHASQEQLRDFQNHIDELNNLIRSQGSPSYSVQNYDSRPPPPSNHSYRPPPNPTPLAPSPVSSSPYAPPLPPPAPGHVKVEAQPQYYSPIPQPPKPKPPPPSRLDIIAVVFDFCGGNGDRFTFPRFTILEYLPGGTQIIASFLVIRKGNLAASGDYSKNMTYYQPVTVRLSSPNPKLFEPLARVVAPQEEVRKYMNSVFDKMQPVKESFLAIRLPKARDDEDVEMKEAPVEAQPALIKRVYSPPSSLVPLAASITT